MEGNTLTYSHTQILLRSGDVVGKYNIRELQEMKAHDLALKIVREAAGDPEFTLTQKFIKEINETILVEPFYNDAITADGRKTKKLITPGKYKSTPNSVLMANGEMFFYPSPEETPALMTDLLDWYETESKEKKLHPVQIAALLHYKFVRIHPFDDSNGRTARLLMNYILLKSEYAPLVIESADKKNYLIALNEADAGNINAFIEYVVLISVKWQDKFLKAIKGESTEDEDDVAKEIHLLKKRIKTSSKDEKTLTKTSFQKTCLESILPFLLIVFDKLSELDSVFLKKQISFISENYGYGILTNIEADFNSIVNGISNNVLPEKFSITFTYTHDGLAKHENSDFIVVSAFNVNFYEKYYEISSPDFKKTFLKKFYYEKISATESINFSKLLLKAKLKTINEKLGK
ncbi:MAG: Fic family protein [Chitinophagaceae bacterium]|nr:Fic family protein [Chitinophagaceae bacterium]